MAKEAQNNGVRSKVVMTEAEAAAAEPALNELASKDPPAEQKIYRGVAIVVRFYEQISRALSRGWDWDEIRKALPASVQKLKPKTLERYYQFHKEEIAAASKKDRHAKKEPTSAADTRKTESSGKTQKTGVDAQATGKYENEVV